jgi:hypothetical protein
MMEAVIYHVKVLFLAELRKTMKRPSDRIASDQAKI